MHVVAFCKLANNVAMIDWPLFVCLFVLLSINPSVIIVSFRKYMYIYVISEK